MNIDIIKTILIVPIIDYIYLSSLSSYYNKQILDVQKSPMKFRLIPAIFCYIALVFALYYFIINTNNTRKQKILNAFLLGLCIYAVYETTNYTLLTDWTLKTVIIDTLWGGVLFGVATFFITL